MSHWKLSRRELARMTGGLALAGALSPALSRVALAQTPSPAAEKDVSGTLIMGKSEEAVGLDPAMVTASSSFELIAAVYETLVVFDDDGQPQPWLATTWEQPDDTTYAFTLREGVMFQGGDHALTADDVVYTFTRLMDADGGSPWVSQFAPVDTVEATDPQTVTFKLKQGYGPFLATLSSNYAAIVPNIEGQDLQTTMNGTGAFGLETYTKDTETDLAAHMGYWQPDQPKLAGISYRIMPDESSRVAALRSGEIHLTSLVDPVSIETVKGDGSITLIDQDTTDYYLLGLNCKQAPFDNVKVRQALSMAIDRQAIVDNVFFGSGQVSGPIVPTLGDWATPIDQLPNYGVDTDGAKALLEEAGASDLSFKIVVGADRTEFVNIALVIQDQLKKIGVTVELDQVEWGTFIDRWKARDFQSFVSFNGSGNDPDRALYPALYTDGSVNASQYSDPELDKMLDQAREAATFEERQPIYAKIEQQVAEAAPQLFLCTRVAHYATTQAVQGFAPSASQTWRTLPDTTVGGE